MNIADLLFGIAVLYFLYLIVNKWLEVYFDPNNVALRR